MCSPGLFSLFKITEAGDGFQHSVYIIPRGVTPVEAEAVQDITGVVVVTLDDGGLLSVGNILVGQNGREQLGLFRVLSSLINGLLEFGIFNKAYFPAYLRHKLEHVAQQLWASAVTIWVICCSI